MKKYRITIFWTQLGHTVFDPTGQREFDLGCSWAETTGSVASLIEKADRYGEEQIERSNWLRFNVITEELPI